VYFVNIEVWVEAENALGNVSSEHINFDPVDKGSYELEFENLLDYPVVYKLFFQILMTVETSIYVISIAGFTKPFYQQY
jgi:hypothetical protein